MIEGLNIVTMMVLLVLVVVFCVMDIYALRFLRAAQKQKKLAETYVKAVEVQTKKEYNKIAMLSPKDLGSFLTEVYAKQLVLCAEEAVDPSDPHATERLHMKTLEAMYHYLGAETLDAINFYYGVSTDSEGKEIGYVTRWCEYAFNAMLSAGEIGKILRKRQQAVSEEKSTALK